MTELSKYWEREDLGGGVFRHVQHISPIAYDDAGTWRPIASDWLDGGGGAQVVTAAPFMVTAGSDGMRRIHPTRDLAKYFELGRPYVKVGGVWQQPAWNPFTKAGNLLTSTNTNFNAYIRHGGHFLKFGFLLKNSYVPQDRLIAFPVGLVGLTRDGTTILDNGEPVMRMRPMRVWDFDVYGENEPDNAYQIAHSLVQMNGQWFILMTLPVEVASMGRPLIDPTYAVQPDATAGLDTYLAQWAATTNYGTAANLRTNRAGASQSARTLIKFDLSSIPAGANISSAVFSMLLYTGDGGHAYTETQYLYRVKRAWVEAEATWNIYSSGNNWSTAGGFHADDCEQTHIATGTASQAAVGTFVDFVITAAVKEDLDLGNGWLIKGNESSAFHYSLWSSSDYATATDRPKLTVVYTTAAGNAARADYYRRRRT